MMLVSKSAVVNICSNAYDCQSIADGRICIGKARVIHCYVAAKVVYHQCVKVSDDTRSNVKNS